MKSLRTVFKAGYFVVSLLFLLSGAALIVFAGAFFWEGVSPISPDGITVRLNTVLEGIAALTIAVAALELGQTVLEEEVQRQVNISAPTRVRRFLSRFMIVIVIALAIEYLVAVFGFVHDEPARIPDVTGIGLVAAALLIGWGLFVYLNRSAEELEPEAMEETKREDTLVE